MVSVNFIRYFLSNFTFFTIGWLFALRSVKLIKKFVRKIITRQPIIAHLFQCLIGLSSVPSFISLINFSDLSRSLYKIRIFSGSSSNDDSRIKLRKGLAKAAVITSLAGLIGTSGFFGLSYLKQGEELADLQEKAAITFAKQAKAGLTAEKELSKKITEYHKRRIQDSERRTDLFDLGRRLLELQILLSKEKPDVDKKLMTQIKSFIKCFHDNINKIPQRDKLVEEYKWMLEEYRVAIFAQTLKTRGSVSAKRLQKVWNEIKEKYKL